MTRPTRSVPRPGVSARKMGVSTLMLLVMALAPATVAASCDPPARPDTGDTHSVGRYDVYEISLPHASAGLVNPWEDVTVTVTVSSPTRTFDIGGFFYTPGTWKARIAPDSVGRWRWTARINDPRGNEQQQGSFEVVDSGLAGFVQPDPANPLGLVTSDGRAFHPIGYQHTLSDDTGSGTPFDEIGFDGQDVSRCSADPRCITVLGEDGSRRWSSWVTDLGTKAAAFGRNGAGFNLYRWGVDNASFPLYERIDPAGNVYLEREGRWGDELVQTLRANGIRVFMTMLGFTAPYADAGEHDDAPANEHTNEHALAGGHAAGGVPAGRAFAVRAHPTTGDPAGLEAVKRYARYVVDRYGAYVDFWELMNEVSHVSDSYTNELAAAVRQRDPYHHLISTSWERPHLPAIEIVAPHWYANEDELTSDAAMAEMIERQRPYRKPVIFGEQGNGHASWDPRSAVRYRMRSWSALFAGAGLISWDLSGFTTPPATFGALYIGPEERGYVRVLSSFADQIGPGAAAVPTTASAGLRSYGLTAGGRTWAYVVNARSHTEPTTAAQLTISSPVDATVTFLAPADATILGAIAIRAGRNTLNLPPFTTDLAVTISPSP